MLVGEFHSLSSIVVCRLLWSHVAAHGFCGGLGGAVLLGWALQTHLGNK